MQHSKYYIGGGGLGEEERQDRKSGKSRIEEKVAGFSSPSVFPTRKRETGTQDGTIYTGGETT